jgi:CRISPR/Cas system-associated exonuclease Cas4 (RecB family)
MTRLGTVIEMATRDEADSNVALAGYGSALDMAVKVPTLSGALVALAAGTFVWVWLQLRRRQAN